MIRKIREENIVKLVPLVGQDALTLQGFARSLHRLAEAACNSELTPRQESRQEKLEEKVKAIAKRYNLIPYFQRDPRGWPLYLLRPEQVDEGGLEATYNNGIAVWPH